MFGPFQFASVGAAVLSFMIAAELGLFMETKAPSFAEDSKLSKTTSTPPKQLEAVPNATLGRWVGTLLARPLFEQDRRPQQPASAAIIPTTAALPRLSGVAISPCCRNAIFAVVEASKPLVVQEGRSIGDWRVDSITKNEVRLSGPEGMRVLHPMHEAAPLPLVVKARNAAPTALAR